MSDDKKPELVALDLLEASCNIEFYIGSKNANLIREACGKPTVAEEKAEGEGKVAAAVKKANAAKADKPAAEEKPAEEKKPEAPASEEKKPAEKPVQGIGSKDTDK